MKTLKPYFLFILIIVADIIILLNNVKLGTLIFKSTYMNFSEMLGVIPPIFLLLGLFDVWVPRETIIRFMGEESGITGVLLSIFLGAAAAGPLYGAFPVAGIMIKKGARFSNILIFLGAWSTLKIPMFLFEISSLGVKFAVTRWLVDIIGVILMALVIDRLISGDEKLEIYRKHAEESICSTKR
ncbi:MAG TPA: permease [Thermoanaerobacterales bacterium]|nr:permease [Thermoanaerobacterales bacterium]